MQCESSSSRSAEDMHFVHLMQQNVFADKSGLPCQVRPDMKTGEQDMRYLYEAICTASDQHLAIWREDSTFWVALFAEFDGTV